MMLQRHILAACAFKLLAPAHSHCSIHTAPSTLLHSHCLHLHIQAAPFTLLAPAHSSCSIHTAPFTLLHSQAACTCPFTLLAPAYSHCSIHTACTCPFTLLHSHCLHLHIHKLLAPVHHNHMLLLHSFFAHVMRNYTCPDK